MLSTIHIIEGEESKVHKEHRKPKETSSNNQKVRSVFGNTTRKTLLIPKIIDDYNHHMGNDAARNFHEISEIGLNSFLLPKLFPKF